MTAGNVGSGEGLCWCKHVPAARGSEVVRGPRSGQAAAAPSALSVLTRSAAAAQALQRQPKAHDAAAGDLRGINIFLHRLLGTESSCFSSISPTPVK